MTADIVEAIVAEDLPLRASPSDWCFHNQHLQCPATFWPQKHPDPSRNGAFYTLPGGRCPCKCHTRPVV